MSSTIPTVKLQKAILIEAYNNMGKRDKEILDEGDIAFADVK